MSYLVTRDSGTPDSNLLLAQLERGQLTHYLTDSELGTVATGGYTKGPAGSVIVPMDEERDERMQDVGEAKARTPENIAVRLNYGQLLLEDGQLSDSLEEFNEVLRRDSENTLAQLGQAIVWFRQSRVEDAEAQFARIAADKHVGPAATLNRVICLLAMNRKSEAKELWKSLPDSSQPEKIRRILTAGE